MKTQAQNKRIHGLISELGIPSYSKADIIYSATLGRSESAGDLLYAEAERVIEHLEKLRGTMKKDSPENRMRRKLFSIAHEMKWRSSGQVDKERLMAWVLKYGYLHKPLNKYTAVELPTLIVQFENVLKSYYKNEN